MGVRDQPPRNLAQLEALLQPPLAAAGPPTAYGLHLACPLEVCRQVVRGLIRGDTLQVIPRRPQSSAVWCSAVQGAAGGAGRCAAAELRAAPATLPCMCRTAAAAGCCSGRRCHVGPVYIYTYT